MKLGELIGKLQSATEIAGPDFEVYVGEHRLKITEVAPCVIVTSTGVFVVPAWKQEHSE